MKTYLLYSVFLVGFVYPVAAHAMWSTTGFLSKFAAEPLWGSGAIDLAGSGAVHMTGGVAALVGGYIVGPRIGRYHDENGDPLDEPAEFVPHSTALSFLGTFCLWFGCKYCCGAGFDSVSGRMSSHVSLKPMGFFFLFLLQGMDSTPVASCLLPVPAPLPWPPWSQSTPLWAPVLGPALPCSLRRGSTGEAWDMCRTTRLPP